MNRKLSPEEKGQQVVNAGKSIMAILVFVLILIMIIVVITAVVC